MIDASEVKAELTKIRELAHTKGATDKDKEKAGAMFQRLQALVIEDISKTGDQRTRNLMRMLSEFKL
jgi:hypothetical protein